MKTDINKLTELNEELAAFYAGYLEWFRNTIKGPEDFMQLTGNWQNGNTNIRLDSLVEINRLVTQAVDDLRVAETIIYDLQQEVNGMRPLTWRRNCGDEEIIEVFKRASEPLAFGEARSLLLCRGIDLEGTYQISDVCRRLELEKAMFNVNTFEYVHVESPAWEKMTKRERQRLKKGYRYLDSQKWTFGSKTK